MINPKQLIGHTRCGRYAIRADRGPGCDGWLFVAERQSQNPYGALPAEFGGGSLADQDQSPTRVILEISRDGDPPNPEELQEMKRLHPHVNLLDCLEAGRCQDPDLKGCSYIVTESWKETLHHVLAKRSVLEEDEVRKLAIAIAAALARYHATGRTHGDVRAERICRTVDGQWKLAPAFQRNASSTRTDSKSTDTPQDDIRALGLVLLRCLYRKPASMKEKHGPQLVVKATLEEALASLPNKLWRYWLQRCLAAKPSERCSAAEMALMEAEIPPLAASVSIDRERDQCRVNWERPSKGTVHVYLWNYGRYPLAGEIWQKDDLLHVADPVSHRAPAVTGISFHLRGNGSVIVANVLGDAVRVSDCIPLTSAADVQRLELAVDGNQVVATWDWPPDAHLAHVVTCFGAFATGPEDPQGIAERCFRAGYMAERRFLIPIDRAGIVHVTVYAVYRREDGWECATGRTTGARAAIAFAPKGPPDEGMVKSERRWFANQRVQHH